jgi:hypothetical protein
MNENVKGKRLWVPYPIETIKESLKIIDTLMSENGRGKIIAKEDIRKLTNKKLNSLILYFSTWQQYDILRKVHGEGFSPTEIYIKYHKKAYPFDEKNALVKMFKAPRLYIKIIENLNNQILPPREKFGFVLKEEPYNINPRMVDRVTRVFFKNVYDLNFIDTNNTLHVPLSQNEINSYLNRKEGKETGQLPSLLQREETGDIEIRIPLSKGSAKVRFPADYKDADLDKIGRIIQAYKSATN